MVNIIFDVVIVAIVAIGTIIGAKRGFFKAVLRTFAGLISIIVAYLFAKPLAEMINVRFVYERLEEKISQAVDTHIGNSEAVLDPSALAESVPDSLGVIASIAGYDIKELAASAAEKGQDIIDTFIEASSTVISNVISTVIAFAVLLLSVYIALRILALVLDLIFSHIPVLKQINRTLGLIFGFICSLINSWIFAIVSYSLINALRVASPEFLSGFTREATYLYRFFTGFNPISWFFG